MVCVGLEIGAGDAKSDAAGCNIFAGIETA